MCLCLCLCLFCVRSAGTDVQVCPSEEVALQWVQEFHNFAPNLKIKTILPSSNNKKLGWANRAVREDWSDLADNHAIVAQAETLKHDVVISTSQPSVCLSLSLCLHFRTFHEKPVCW